jgi:valyl-tRNA synthetase
MNNPLIFYCFFDNGAESVEDKGYNPADIEDKWYEYWERNGLFRADNTSTAQPYSIVIPPPNVTGSLHMGHALNNTLQDILIRMKRMQGRNTLWMPGTDHAGIATQNVVEKELAKEGKTRHDLGRDAFVERVWEWRAKYGGVIINQLKKLGSSCDWSRERFTMDEGLTRAVRLVFVTLYNDGLIYRGDYIINWCPRCHTALADLEVEHEQRGGHLYHIRYPIADGSGAYITVATTRPETMFGDTAVAVNPGDKRYAGMAGKKAILPIIEREIPIIFDSYVTMEFGTGALKVTPAHDLNDFQIGNTHGLSRVVVINDDGAMNENAGPYVGMDRWAAREKVVEDLNAAGLLEKMEDYPVPVGTCYRCHTVIEPILKKQWFVKADVLAKEAIKAVEDGRTRIVPKQWEKTYFEWMYNIRDWCVSRQIWWGHRIPAWYCDDCNEIIVSMEAPAACSACKGTNLRQETDVLDTWFSSALWPFSTLGWPDETKDLAVYYPTSVLVTGFDILFFWVARMMMMGLYFKKEVPFHDVYIHALVRDEQGSKMSKSKGNVIDPLTIIDKYGADAFRFTLAAFAAMGRDVKLSEGRIEGYRFFINKLWNATRFVTMNLDERYINSFQAEKNFNFSDEKLGRNIAQMKSVLEERKFSLADKWILSLLDRLVEKVNNSIENYHFNVAANELYQFIWHDFCDWYIEISKIYLNSNDEESRTRVKDVLLYILDTVLKLLHPIIPFVTEELHSKLPSREEALIISRYPAKTGFLESNEAEVSFFVVQQVATGIRNFRGEKNIHPKAELEVWVSCTSQKSAETDVARVKENEEYIRRLANVRIVDVGAKLIQPDATAMKVVEQFTIYIKVIGVINFKEDKTRITKELEKVNGDIRKIEDKLNSKNFVGKAPSDIVEKEREKLIALVSKKARLDDNLKWVEDFIKLSK